MTKAAMSNLTFAVWEKEVELAAVFPRLLLASGDHAASDTVVETYPLELPPTNLR
jgi:hypothetical protein